MVEEVMRILRSSGHEAMVLFGLGKILCTTKWFGQDTSGSIDGAILSLTTQFTTSNETVYSIALTLALHHYSR